MLWRILGGADRPKRRARLNPISTYCAAFPTGGSAWSLPKVPKAAPRPRASRKGLGAGAARSPIEARFADLPRLDGGPWTMLPIGGLQRPPTLGARPDAGCRASTQRSTPARSRRRSTTLRPCPARSARPRRPDRTRPRARRAARRQQPGAVRPARDRRRGRPGRRPTPPGARIADLGLQAVPVALRDVRRIAHDHIEWPRHTFAPAARAGSPPGPPGQVARHCACDRPARAELSSTPSPVACGSSDSSASSRQPEPTPRSSRRSGRARSGSCEAPPRPRSRSRGAIRTARADLEAQAPELLLAKEVGDRFARRGGGVIRASRRPPWAALSPEFTPPAMSAARPAPVAAASSSQPPSARARCRPRRVRGNLSG